MGTGSNDLILVNGWEGSGSGGVATVGQSRSFELSGVSAYVSDTSGNYGNSNYAALITATKNQTPPINFAGYRVLDTLFGVKDPDNSDTKCLVRYQPNQASSNLITDGSFEAPTVEFSNMFGGQTQSILDLDQGAREVDGDTHYTYTYPMGNSFTNAEIDVRRAAFGNKLKYCATYDVKDYTTGKIELGSPSASHTTPSVALQTVIQDGLRSEFELDLTGTSTIPRIGNLTKLADGGGGSAKWTLTRLQCRRIGGGSFTDSSVKTDSARWESWTVSGDTTAGQHGQAQLGWKDGWDGGCAARLIVHDKSGSGGTIYLYQSSIVDNNKRYKAVFKAKGDSGGVVGVMGAAAQGSASDLVTETGTLSTVWSSYELEFWGNDNGQFAIGSFNTSNEGETIHIDDLVLVEVPNAGDIKSGYFAEIQKASSNATTFYAGTLSAKYGKSLIGYGNQSRTIGGAVEVIPRSVEVTYQSENSPLRVRVTGSVQGDAVSSDIEAIKERLQSIDNTIKGEN